MKVFITGASGFVGRAMIGWSLDHGDSVVALARSDTSADSAFDAANGHHIQVLRGDLSDPVILAKGMEGCDVVYHIAAAVEGFGPWSTFKTTTVDGTRNVLKAAAKAKVPRLVHMSSEAVLVKGDMPIEDADETTPLPDDPGFYAPYSKSKAMAERLVVAANDPEGGLTTVIVRPRFVWGKGDSYILPTLTSVMSTGFWPVFRPRFPMSHVHIANVCEGTRLAAQKGRGGQAYFLLDKEQPTDAQDFMLRYAATQGIQPIVCIPIPFWLIWLVMTILESIPYLGIGTLRLGALNRQALALIGHEVTLRDDKARKELGYTSHMSVDEGMQEITVHKKKR